MLFWDSCQRTWRRVGRCIITNFHFCPEPDKKPGLSDHIGVKVVGSSQVWVISEPCWSQWAVVRVARAWVWRSRQGRKVDLKEVLKRKVVLCRDNVWWGLLKKPSTLVSCHHSVHMGLLKIPPLPQPLALHTPIRVGWPFCEENRGCNVWHINSEHMLKILFAIACGLMIFNLK